jgi:hypothetical protein
LTSGIYAAVTKYATALTIKTYGPVTGAQHGIFASFGETDSREPTGALSITAGGSVTGLTGSGIYAANFGLTGSSTSITVTKTGFVQGKVAGVTAYSFYNSAPISITNFGKIQNLSGVSSDLAIRAYGGPITVINNGTVTGVVDFLPSKPTPPPTPTATSIPDPSVINNGIWNTAGGDQSVPRQRVGHGNQQLDRRHQRRQPRRHGPRGYDVQRVGDLHQRRPHQPAQRRARQPARHRQQQQ